MKLDYINEDCCGWTGKLLRIDLNDKKISEEPWDRSRIGGRVFGQWALFDEEPEDCEDFDQRRRLIISSGLLTGTDASAPARLNISSFNLLSGGISSSNVGGSFCAQVKFAGYDHIIITGKADSPVYIHIHDHDVTIMDASKFWGKDTYETDKLIKERHHDPVLSIACIGQAGENLVRIACIIVDKNRAAAWGDIHSFLRLTGDITFRKGLGDVLAEGIKRASEIIGKDSQRLAVISKGVELNEGRLRSHRAWALGIMTSARGGGHLNGAPAAEGIGFDEKLCKEVYGISNVNDPTSYENKARFVVRTEQLRMLVDSVGI